MVWLYEIVGMVTTLLSPLVVNNGLKNPHYPDAILMFVVIPFVHLMNDEETKGIIAEENWYQGVRHMLGIQNQVSPSEP